ncbi:MAG: RNA polymerase sigma factor [Undibacterium sp.]
MEATELSGSEDRQLIRAFRLGNAGAFGLLVEKHTGSIYAFLYRMVQDRAVAEDLTQETFLKTWRSLNRYDETKPFRTWLFAIAKNNAYDWLKKKRPLPFAAFDFDSENEEPFAHVASGELLPDELLHRADAAAELERILGVLPEKYRVLVTLVYQEDFSLHEAAAILGESYNTVKSRHQRAMARLRTLLADPGASGSV